jgi:hypothetical protein
VWRVEGSGTSQVKNSGVLHSWQWREARWRQGLGWLGMGTNRLHVTSRDWMVGHHESRRGNNGKLPSLSNQSFSERNDGVKG